VTTDSWAGVRRILCVRLDNMGDVLMTTPALRALKRQCPGRRLTLLTSPSGAVLAPHLEDVDEVMAHRAPWVKHADKPDDHCEALIADLRRGGFDAAVIFTVYSQSALPAALACHMAGIPRVLAHVRENPYELVSDWVKETEPQQGIRHEVQRQLDLVAAVGAHCTDTRLAFKTRSRDRARMAAALQAAQVPAGASWIVVHTGATAASRRYGPRKFADVLNGLRAAGRSLVLTGSAHEHAAVQQIMRDSGLTDGVYNLAGALDLGALGSLIEEADLLVSNNTGPVHIAAAVQTPVVDLYALTNPQHTPWKVAHRLLHRDVPCKYCYRSVCPKNTNACLEGVTPQEVVDAARELLAQRRTRADRRAA